MEKSLAKIKLLILDVDGVMTDGRIMVNERGEETKSFHVKDGQGLKMLMRGGIDVVIVSCRRSGAVEYRAKELGIRDVFQGVNDKGALIEQLIQERNLTREQVCCMGDDLPDLAVYEQVGISVAVSDAAEELRHEAALITKNRGGMGAVREVCEWILKAREKWS
jgi:YrbI family 3-deoxy-D-manno-octulosonate 8-phosphate phosphatase